MLFDIQLGACGGLLGLVTRVMRSEMGGIASRQARKVCFWPDAVIALGGSPILFSIAAMEGITRHICLVPVTMVSSMSCLVEVSIADISAPMYRKDEIWLFENRTAT